MSLPTQFFDRTVTHNASSSVYNLETGFCRTSAFRTLTMDSTIAPEPKEGESEMPGTTRSPDTTTLGNSVAEGPEFIPGQQSPLGSENYDKLNQRSVGTRSCATEGLEQAEKRLEKMHGAVRTLIECVGDDPNREGLLDTPKRYVETLLFFTKGYHDNVDNIVNNAIFHEANRGMVIVKDIDV